MSSAASVVVQDVTLLSTYCQHTKMQLRSTVSSQSFVIFTVITTTIEFPVNLSTADATPSTECEKTMKDSACMFRWCWIGLTTSALDASQTAVLVEEGVCVGHNRVDKVSQEHYLDRRDLFTGLCRCAVISVRQEHAEVCGYGAAAVTHMGLPCQVTSILTPYCKCSV